MCLVTWALQPLPAQKNRCACSVTWAYLLKSWEIERGQITLSLDNHKANKQVFRETMASCRLCRAGCQFGGLSRTFAFHSSSSSSSRHHICWSPSARYCARFFPCSFPLLPLCSPVRRGVAYSTGIGVRQTRAWTPALPQADWLGASQCLRIRRGNVGNIGSPEPGME